MYNNRVSIQDLGRKFKGLWTNAEYLLALLIIVISLVSFWLGRLSVEEVHTQAHRTSLEDMRAAAVTATRKTQDTTDAIGQNDESVTAPEGGYVASKNGTKYHLPWCGSAKQISEQNKIFFATKAEAEAAGYTPASNCKGI